MDTIGMVIFVSILLKVVASLAGSLCKEATSPCKMEDKKGYICQYGICVCDTGYYSIGDNCESIDDLKPTNMSISDITSSSFKLSWHERVNLNTSIKYLIISDKFNQTINNSSITSVIINGLSPSTQYNNITVEAVIQTKSGIFAVSSESISIFTKKKTSEVIPITVAVVLSIAGLSTYILKSVYGRFCNQRHKNKRDVRTDYEQTQL